MSETKKKRKPLKIALITIGVLILLLLLSFLPIFNLNTGDMKTLEGEYVTVYYEQEEEAAKDIFEVVNAKSASVAETLDFDEPQSIRFFIYDDQKTFQSKKYGLIATMLGLDWFVGASAGPNVLLTSPANPGPQHSYDEIVNDIAVHEMVHSYNYLINKDMPEWITEGLAVYVTNQTPGYPVYDSQPVPSLQQMKTANPLEFANIGGYQFAYTYIEFLDENYGWASVLSLAHTNDYIISFGVEEEVIYEEWVEFLKQNYSE